MASHKLRCTMSVATNGVAQYNMHHTKGSEGRRTKGANLRPPMETEKCFFFRKFEFEILPQRMLYWQLRSISAAVSCLASVPEIGHCFLHVESNIIKHDLIGNSVAVESLSLILNM